MLISFPADVLEDLRRFEDRTGVPVEEQVRDAVMLWSRLSTPAERRIVARAALRLVQARRRPTLTEIASGEDDEEAEARAAISAYYADRAAERRAVFDSVRGDLLAGRIGRRGALERLSLPEWTVLCEEMDVETLRKALEDDR